MCPFCGCTENTFEGVAHDADETRCAGCKRLMSMAMWATDYYRADWAEAPYVRISGVLKEH